MTPARPPIMTTAERDRLKQRAMLVSASAATLLTVAKILVATTTHSVAVLSEVIHSLSDLVAAGIVWFSLRRAAAPADDRHRYGHGKLEDAASIIEGTIVLGAVVYIVWQATGDLVNGEHVHSPLLVTAVMLGSAVVNLAVGMHLRAVAARTDSPGVRADSQQLLTDVLTSVAVAVGLLLVKITGWESFDPLAALVVAGFVIRIGLRMIIGASRYLLDEALPDAEVRRIELLMAREFPGIGFHRLRTRRSGSRRHVDLHLTLEDTTPLWKAHDTANRVERAIRDELGDADVLTHVEPRSEQPPPGAEYGPSDADV